MKRQYWTWGCECGDFNEKYFRTEKTARAALDAHNKKCRGESGYWQDVWRCRSIDIKCKHCGVTREVAV
jgi:hypothetical protein